MAGRNRKASFDLNLLDDDPILGTVGTTPHHPPVDTTTNLVHPYHHHHHHHSAIDHITALGKIDSSYNNHHHHPTDDCCDNTPDDPTISSEMSSTAFAHLATGSEFYDHHTTPHNFLSRMLFDQKSSSQQRHRGHSWGGMSDMTTPHDDDSNNQTQQSLAASLACNALHDLADDCLAVAESLDFMAVPMERLGEAIPMPSPPGGSLASGSGSVTTVRSTVEDHIAALASAAVVAALDTEGDVLGNVEVPKGLVMSLEEVEEVEKAVAKREEEEEMKVAVMEESVEDAAVRAALAVQLQFESEQTKKEGKGKTMAAVGKDIFSCKNGTVVGPRQTNCKPPVGPTSKKTSSGSDSDQPLYINNINNSITSNKSSNNVNTPPPPPSSTIPAIPIPKIPLPSSPPSKQSTPRKRKITSSPSTPSKTRKSPQTTPLRSNRTSKTTLHRSTPPSSTRHVSSSPAATSTTTSPSPSKGQSNQKWDDMFDCLVTFIKEKRREALLDSSGAMVASEKDDVGGGGETSSWEWDGNVPTTYKTSDGKALGRWINNQRSAKHKGVLKREREIRLVSTGLKWSVLSTNSWTDMMNELKLYVKEKTKDGKEWDGNVPTNYRIKSNTADDGSEIDEEKNLGRWINRQRSLFQCGKLKKERQKDLETIGLKWSVLSTSTWQSMYESLRDYVQMKRQADSRGEWDGNVPANYKTNTTPPKNLGRWVNRQRSAQAKNKLKEEYVVKLEALGLKWTMHEKKVESSTTATSTTSPPPATTNNNKIGNDDDVVTTTTTPPITIASDLKKESDETTTTTTTTTLLDVTPSLPQDAITTAAAAAAAAACVTDDAKSPLNGESVATSGDNSQNSTSSSKDDDEIIGADVTTSSSSSLKEMEPQEVLSSTNTMPI